MSHFKTLLIASLFTFIGWNTQAQSVPTQQQQAPAWHRVQGEPLSILWPDGREARAKVIQIDSPVIHSKVKVVDSTCSNRQGMTCEYTYQFRRFFVEMIWTKNPDASKLGQVVVRSYNSDDSFPQKLEAPDVFVTGILQGASLDKNLVPHSFSCDDFSFLPGAAKEAPTNLHVSRWDNEDNTPNIETGVMENRTVGGAYGVDLIKTDGNSLQIQKIRSLLGNLIYSPLLAIGTNQSLSLITSSGDICQVGLSASGTADIANIYRGLEKKKNDMNLELKTLPDYIYGSDSLTENVLFKSETQYWIDSYGTYK